MASNVSDTNRADSGGTTMHVDTGEFRALRDQVAALTERLEEVARQAAVSRALREIFEEAPAADNGPGCIRQRRHLRVIGDDAS